MKYAKLPLRYCESLSKDDALLLEKLLRRKRPASTQNTIGSVQQFSAQPATTQKRVKRVKGKWIIIRMDWIYDNEPSYYHDELHIFRVDSGFGRRYYPLASYEYYKNNVEKRMSGIDGECPDLYKNLYQNAQEVQRAIEWKAHRLLEDSTKKTVTSH